MNFRLATEHDLAAILSIYNQVIEQRTVTADLVPATPESRKAWFEQHHKSEKYPLWVLELEGKIVAWCGYSQFYTRAAYDGTTEISFYLDKTIQGQGLGKQCVDFLIAQMPRYKMTKLLAFVFGNNQPSLGLLKKCGFQQYGLLPKVADMQTHWEDLVILGFEAENE